MLLILILFALEYKSLLKYTLKSTNTNSAFQDKLTFRQAFSCNSRQELTAPGGQRHLRRYEQTYDRKYEMQLQIDLADVKFTSLQTQLNASL